MATVHRPPDTGLPDLSVRQLEYLDAVHRAPTWAAAAEAIGVTPSALSQGLAELERRLGLPLFARAGRRRIPTEAAAPVLDHARRVLAQTADLARWAEEARSGHRGRLRVGMIDAAAVGHHPEVLRRFRQRHPDVELRLAVAPSSVLLADLRAGAVDLVVCVAPTDGGADAEDLRVTPLLEESLSVYGPQTTPPPRRRSDPATWGPWVLFPTGSHTRELIDRALAGAGARLEVVAESHQPEVLREMVRLGMGWTVLPTIQAERPPDPLARARPAALATRHLVAVRRADALADPAADALLALLIEG